MSFSTIAKNEFLRLLYLVSLHLLIVINLKFNKNNDLIIIKLERLSNKHLLSSIQNNRTIYFITLI